MTQKPPGRVVPRRLLVLASLIASILLVTLSLAAGSARSPQELLLTGIPDVFMPLVSRRDLPSATPTVTPSASATLAASSPTPTATGGVTLATATPSQPATTGVLEGFENADVNGWQVQRDTAGNGGVSRSSDQAAAGQYAAKLAAGGNSSLAQLRLNFSDPAASHTWQERPGTWRWQRAKVYLPASTLAELGPGEYLTLAGFWASGAGNGWWLRVRQGGELFVVGHRDWDNSAIEFRAYGTIPADQWVSLEIGLHSQAGPGVERAFAFVLDGSFYGWYHQGRMQDETYDRSALGILSTNSPNPLVLYVDEWGQPGSTSWPTGSDNRPTGDPQVQDYRSQSGAGWQIDWATWENDLRLHPQYGLYSQTNRLQSGRNLDRAPDLTSGWAEIEIDWPQGTPPTSPSSYFGPMVGFRKEINREENLEVIPIGAGNGQVNLVLEAWINGGPLILAEWPLPLASIGGGSHIPEPGDIIRVRWEQINASQLNVRASYWDASADTWYADAINHTFNNTSVTREGVTVDFTDGFHLASSVTIDSPYYSIRRFTVGTLASYP